MVERPSYAAAQGVSQTVAATGSTVVQAGGDVITGHVFLGRFARLRDVWLDPRPVFDEVGIDHFVGRDWLVSGVDRFIRSHDRGYVVVEAAAGLGKSAFAAWLARDRGWPCHFTRRRRGWVTATALRNLAVQLIARFRLDERFAPGGVLPETAGEPGWFDQVLVEASIVARAAGEPLVLVVDGLDEAEHVAGDLPLGLPSTLPLGVFIVVTCRTGTGLPALRRPWQSLSITAADRRNTADLRRYLIDAAGAEPLASLLARHGVPVKSLVRDLVERRGGVWVYARYVLDEIRYGLRSPAEVDLLPGDLAHYYFECLSALRHASAWSALHLPVLGTLAAAAEPLTVDTLTRLAGVRDRAAVREMCVGRMRPFLSESDAADGRRYGIYHASLREILTGIVPGHISDGVRSRVEELAEATREAHNRIADHYLGLFGGLDDQLTVLGDDPSAAVADGGYALRHLTRHLTEAGRVGEVHRLLACERVTGKDKCRNVWFDAHNTAGTVDDYLADVAHARRHSEAETNARIAKRLPAPSIALEIRYALITAGITTLTANVPVPLLIRLVTSGRWPHTRALAHARHLHLAGDRARALTGLLDHLPGSLRPIVAAEALTAARAMPEDAWKATALNDLARHLPERERISALSDALTAVRGITVDEEQGWQLAALGPHLPGSLLAQAFATATAIGDERARADAIVRLLRHLPDSFAPDVLAAARATSDATSRADILRKAIRRLPDALLAEAFALTRDITDAAERAWVLCELAERAPYGGAVAQEAVEAALAATEPWGRAWALTTVKRLDESLIALSIDALAAARAVEETALKALALRLVADHLPEPERDDVIKEAISVAATLDDEEELALLVQRLADNWPDDPNLEELLVLAQRMHGWKPRAWALTSVAVHLPAAEREGLLGEALTDTAAADEEGDRADLVDLLAPHLSEAQLVRAIAEVRKMREGFYRTYALGALAPHLPEALVGDALSAVQTITDEDAHALLITELAAHRPAPRRQRLLEHATEIVRDITDEHSRTQVLDRLARHVGDGARAGIVEQALTTARAIRRPIGRAWSIAQVAAHLPPADEMSALAESRAAIDEIGDREIRAWMLGRLAIRFPQPEREAILDDAVKVARTIPAASYRVPVLVAVAAEMQPPRSYEVLAEAVSLAKTFGKEDGVVARALGRLVRYAPERTLTTLLDAVRAALGAGGSAWESEDPQYAELARHVPRVPRRLVEEALDATRALPGDYDMTPVWGAVALHLTGPVRERALAEVLDAARGGAQARSALLRQAALMWDTELGVEELNIVRRVLTGLDFGDCQRVLADLPKAVYTLGDESAAEDVIEAADAVRRWWSPPKPPSDVPTVRDARS